MSLSSGHAPRTLSHIEACAAKRKSECLAIPLSRTSSRTYALSLARDYIVRDPVNHQARECTLHTHVQVRSEHDSVAFLGGHRVGGGWVGDSCMLSDMLHGVTVSSLVVD